MTRATALFLLCYPEKEELKTISLENGRKLSCRGNSSGIFTFGTFSDSRKKKLKKMTEV